MHFFEINQIQTKYIHWNCFGQTTCLPCKFLILLVFLPNVFHRIHWIILYSALSCQAESNFFWQPLEPIIYKMNVNDPWAKRSSLQEYDRQQLTKPPWNDLLFFFRKGLLFTFAELVWAHSEKCTHCKGTIQRIIRLPTATNNQMPHKNMRQQQIKYEVKTKLKWEWCRHAQFKWMAHCWRTSVDRRTTSPPPMHWVWWTLDSGRDLWTDESCQCVIVYITHGWSKLAAPNWSS